MDCGLEVISNCVNITSKDSKVDEMSGENIRFHGIKGYFVVHKRKAPIWLFVRFRGFIIIRSTHHFQWLISTQFALKMFIVHG